METKYLLVSAAFLLVLLSGCLRTNNGQSTVGTLEGKVTIGPLCPVEPCNISAEQMAQAYAGRKIFIYAKDMNTLLKTVDINADGTYGIELAPGQYIVDTNHLAVGSVKGAPKLVDITAGKTTKADIEIDTGIR